MTAALSALGAGTRPTTAECPKNMTYGPCGGVHADGSCETGAPCSFLGTPTVRWEPEPGTGAGGVAGSLAPAATSAAPLGTTNVGSPASAVDGLRTAPGPTTAALATRHLLARRTVVTVDFFARNARTDALQRLAGVLREGVDAVVLGEPPGLDASLSPSYRALVLQAAGLPVWSGVNARDRNRVAIEGELAALADIGVGAVLCVTGDHTSSTVRPDAKPVFDLDSTQIAALARRSGQVVAVAEAPHAPPGVARIDRLREKVRAGAELCFLNLCDLREAAALLTAIDDAALPVESIVTIPLLLDPSIAERLARLPGVALPDGLAERVAGAADHAAEGHRAACELADQALALPGVVGVNLAVIGASGLADEAVSDAVVRAGRAIPRAARALPATRAGAAPPTDPARLRDQR